MSVLAMFKNPNIIRNRISSKVQNKLVPVKEEDIENKPERRISLSDFIKKVNILIGVIFMLIAGYKYAWYIETLHENSFWFSAIEEVEREISFRTETGLYYSYYKQLVQSPSFFKGIFDLIFDNITEHGRNINIFHRFNIYPEVCLAAVYRLLYRKITLLPIFFYLKAIWILHGVYIGSLYLLTWIISDSWLAGILSLILFITNRYDMTRIQTGPPLRENLSIPFLFLQLTCVVYYLNSYSDKNQKYVLGLIHLWTFLYCICWQFSPFIVLMQSFVLFCLALLDFIPLMKVNRLFVCNLSSLFGVGILHFFTPLFLTSLAFSFIPIATLILNYKNKYTSKCGIVYNTLKLLHHIIITFVLTFLLSVFIKQYFNEKADSHIYKYILLKFGIGNPRDFESRIYYCSPAFQFMKFFTIVDLSRSFLFPLYCVQVICCLASLTRHLSTQWRFSAPEIETLKPSTSSLYSKKNSKYCYPRSDISFLVGLSLLFGVMAVTTARMIVLWAPLMCILASVVLTDKHIWNFILTKVYITNKKVIFLIRQSVTLLLIVRVLHMSLPELVQEFKMLGEFWDPDTVALMNWINEKTEKSASFSGSMQLLAGVKLCTGHPITNHPHFEDQWLRERTLQVYQIYGRKPPHEVHRILKKIGTNYIILEDSICLISPKENNNCRLRDLVDLSNGHVPEYSNGEPGLEHTHVPSFCEAVRYKRKEYSQFFKLVFENRTFKVYKVL